MRGLQRINNRQDLQSFVHLWGRIQRVRLTEERDTIAWKLTADKSYSARSAYEVQFLGRMLQQDLERVWQVKAEAKVQFFIWLLLQDRVWTADRLQRRGWPHDDRCSLCDQVLEDANHLGLHCPFTKEVWMDFATSHQRVTQISALAINLHDWWQKLHQGSKSLVTQQNTISCYVLWNVWNERNRRIFQNLELRPAAVAKLARQEDRKSTRLNSSHSGESRMPSSA